MTTVKLAKEKANKYYKNGNYMESINSYSTAISNAESDDNELHIYYRYIKELLHVYIDITYSQAIYL